jgi:hypothetical protein
MISLSLSLYYAAEVELFDFLSIPLRIPGVPLSVPTPMSTGFHPEPASGL